MTALHTTTQLKLHSNGSVTTNRRKTHHDSTLMDRKPNAEVVVLEASPVDTPPPTPTAMTSSAHAFIEEIRSIHAALLTLPNLVPGPKINALLTRLVDLCTLPYGNDFANYVLNIKGVSELCLQLRPICGAAEGELERHWAQRILSTAQSQSRRESPSPYLSIPALTLDTASPNLLALFPYHNNYTDLSRLECSALEAFLPVCSSACRPTPCSIVFIGSGPLPLTSFCVSDRYPDAVVWNIDRDAEALALSEHVATTTGYGPKMRFVHEDVSSGGTRRGGWRASEVVFLAALVGLDSPAKLAILRLLASQLQPGTLVLARSARGVRGVLYPVLELSDDLGRMGFEILAEVHPWTKVVNSVIVLRVRER
jgi:nicotianamine synthase